MCPPPTALVCHQPPMTDERCQRSVNESSGPVVRAATDPTSSSRFRPSTTCTKGQCTRGSLPARPSVGDHEVLPATVERLPGDATRELSTKVRGLGIGRARRSDDLCGRAPCVVCPGNRHDLGARGADVVRTSWRCAPRRAHDASATCRIFRSGGCWRLSAGSQAAHFPREIVEKCSRYRGSRIMLGEVSARAEPPIGSAQGLAPAPAPALRALCTCGHPIIPRLNADPSREPLSRPTSVGLRWHQVAVVRWWKDRNRVVIRRGGVPGDLLGRPAAAISLVSWSTERPPAVEGRPELPALCASWLAPPEIAERQLRNRRLGRAQIG
jgi:hypothetical protein